MCMKGWAWKGGVQENDAKNTAQCASELSQMKT